MKTQGFITKIMPLKKAVESYNNLPEELKLWDNFENYKKLNYDKRNINVFLLFYFNEIVAGLVFYEQSYINNKFRTGYSPHPNLSVPYAHIFIKREDSVRANEQLYEIFIDELTNFIQKRFVRFSIILPPQYYDIRDFYWNKWDIKAKYTYILDLEKVKSTSLSMHVGKKVRNIIKYVREELVVKKITAKEFFNCYNDTYQRQGKKCPKPINFFERLEKLQNVYFFGAFKDQQLTSGAIIGEVGENGYYITSGALDEFRNSNGVSLILYCYFEQLLSEEQLKVKKFDFVGANDKRISHFKANFKPEIIPHFEVSKQSVYYRLIMAILKQFHLI